MYRIYSSLSPFIPNPSMSDIPPQQVAQNKPCRSCLTALEAAVSMARLVLRVERDMIPNPLTQEGLNTIAEVTQALATLPDDSLSDYQVIGANESIENTAVGTSTAGESAIPLVADPATEDHHSGTPGRTVQQFSEMHHALAAYQAAVLAGTVAYNDLSTLIPILKALTFTLILVVLALLPLILAVLSLAVIFLLSA
ncbi:uncharacterized protein LACBIDRAFT_328045 [Laccaria bicolor S238N-H82]|uniref:Predicted protein n=1 Tax=Laccaria bicolor (strain S238N-H82 / ATCC MYA-4686) TaxID=486041 RepID=B0DDK7_LACBS|nr:uncharacterized protein LACBIDRAFT_328045 [Laccaria bicolor S238N-H82]EDR07233.1 predicted protein [Laccaria bicolor S238N-H82]|eukprot:XP_001882164.1 predicted protein [Laccaria bicolor S238N-H82]